METIFVKRLPPPKIILKVITKIIGDRRKSPPLLTKYAFMHKNDSKYKKPS